MKTETKFYSPTKALSYGTPWIFSLGNRSIGKTFGWTCKLINSFLDRGDKFIYMRRYDDDLKKVSPSFFDNVQFKYPSTEFKVEGNGKSGTMFLINNRPAGLTVALSLATKFKSVGFADFKYILFDEFLPEDGRYLHDEVGLALNFYQSVARGYGMAIRPDVKFIFIANNVTMYNPYFIDLHILESVSKETHYCVDKDRAWLVEFTQNKEIAKEIASTPFGKMIAKTRYGDYALKSEYYLDSPEFIEKPTGDNSYYCTIASHGKKYGVYEYTDEGLFYISKKVDNNNPHIFSLTTADHKTNTLLMHKSLSDPLCQLLKFAFDNACMRFQDGECKNMFLEFMAYS